MKKSKGHHRICHTSLGSHYLLLFVFLKDQSRILDLLGMVNVRMRLNFSVGIVVAEDENIFKLGEYPD